MKDVPESVDVCVVQQLPVQTCLHMNTLHQRDCVLCVQLKFHKDIVVCLCQQCGESR